MLVAFLGCVVWTLFGFSIGYFIAYILAPSRRKRKPKNARNQLRNKIAAIVGVPNGAVTIVDAESRHIFGLLLAKGKVKGEAKGEAKGKDKDEDEDDGAVPDPARYRTIELWSKAVTVKRNSSMTYFSKLLVDRQSKMPLGASLIDSIEKIPATIWPNLKEYTECASVTSALCARLKMRYDRTILDNPSIVTYVIGDGSRPQGAALVKSFAPGWTVHSIDPALKVDVWAPLAGTQGFFMHPQKAEDFVIDQKANPLGLKGQTGHLSAQTGLSIVLAIHGHADFDEFWKRLPTPKIGVALPCCRRQFVTGLRPIECFHDMGIYHKNEFKKKNSKPRRTIAVWEQF